jgi:hypothetical protein
MPREPVAPAGRSIAQWAREAGISRSAFYLLPHDARPAFVRIGKRVVIRETPASWLERMSERGGLPPLRPAA